MHRDPGRRAAAAALALALGTATGAAAQPSTILNTYVLFAQDNMRIRTATVSDGDLGVNDGLLYLRGAVLGPNSDFVGDIVHMDSTTSCDQLYANALVGGSASCPKALGIFPNPLFADLAAASGFQAPPGACANDPAKSVLVDHNETRVLGPGTYGDLVVEGGGEGPAVLKLAGGTYRFCNLRVGRNGSLLFQAPATVFVDGVSRISNSTDVGPDPALGSSAPPPGAIKLFVAGTQARFSRRGNIALYASAPFGKMIIGSGTALTGRFIARSIRMKKSTVTFAPPVPGVCGDTVLSPGEQCETDNHCTGGKLCLGCVCGTPTTTTTLPGCDDDEDCNPGSPGGTFVCEDGHCIPGCDDDEDCNPGSPGGTFVCEDGHCIPGCDDDQDCNTSPGGAFVCEDGHCVTTTVTTTTGPATTTTPTSSTSTTLRSCSDDDDCPIGVCRDGFCVPECDSDDDCNLGSPGGALVCIDGRCVPGGEACADCVDNDGDGFIDFEDPDCCDGQDGQLFAMDLRKGRVRPRSASQSLLRLKGGLARSGLAGRIAPPTDVVGVQIRSEDAGEILCATIPAGKFVKKRRAYRFSQKKTPLPVELGRNLDRITIKVLKNGQVRFRVKGKRAAVTTPPEGTLQITVGFTRPGASASENVCSQAIRLFRGGKKGQLTFP
jgi:hypothetical protein